MRTIFSQFMRICIPLLKQLVIAGVFILFLHIGLVGVPYLIFDDFWAQSLLELLGYLSVGRPSYDLSSVFDIFVLALSLIYFLPYILIGLACSFDFNLGLTEQLLMRLGSRIKFYLFRVGLALFAVLLIIVLEVLLFALIARNFDLSLSDNFFRGASLPFLSKQISPQWFMLFILSSVLGIASLVQVVLLIRIKWPVMLSFGVSAIIFIGTQMLPQGFFPLSSLTLARSPVLNLANIGDPALYHIFGLLILYLALVILGVFIFKRTDLHTIKENLL